MTKKKQGHKFHHRELGLISYLNRKQRKADYRCFSRFKEGKNFKPSWKKNGKVLSCRNTQCDSSSTGGKMVT
jgi:hypothetical protein